MREGEREGGGRESSDEDLVNLNGFMTSGGMNFFTETINKY